MCERRTRHEDAIMDRQDNVPSGCRGDGPDRHAPPCSRGERRARHEHAGERDAWRRRTPRWRRWRPRLGPGSPLAASLQWKAERLLLHPPLQPLFVRHLPLLSSAEVPGADVLVLLSQLRRVLPTRGELPGVMGAAAGFLTV